MKLIKLITLLVLLTLFFSCNNNKKVIPEESVEMEELVEEVQTKEIFAEEIIDKSSMDKSVADVIEYKDINGSKTWTWSGVRDCCNEEDLKKKIESQMTIWAKAEVKKYPGYRLSTWGAKPATAECRYGERPTQGRWCNGSIHVKFYAKIYKF